MRCRNKKKRRILPILLIPVIIGMIGIFGYVFMTISSAPKIDPTKIYDEISKNTVLYDKDGEEITTLHYGEDREIIEIAQMPDNLKNAFIAIEDKTFYKHHGINYKRIIGAIWSSIRGDGEIQGTSTITQQLARNVYLPEIKSERSIKRKLIEAYYAKVIESTLSKDQILEAYLNVIYLGYGSYGVGTASDTYFSKKVSELDLRECAALAALPQAPDTYALINEDGVNDSSKERRYLVLDLMESQGYIDNADEAKCELSEFINPNLEKRSSMNSYFTDYVVGEVIKGFIEKGMSEEDAERFTYTGGLSIHTTLDSGIQNTVYEEFQNDYNFPWAPEEPEAAMVITEVGTGKILAMMGGRDPSGEKLFNRATSPRQPGSSIKPLSVYGAALQASHDYVMAGQPYPFMNYGVDRQGGSGWGNYITAASQVKDERLTFNGQTWPYNFNKRFSGSQTFRTALQQSLNTCAVKIQLQVGTDKSIQSLKDFGITTMVEDGDVNDQNPAAMALGAMTEGVTPLEMALAYAAFPNGGKLNSAVCYTAVTKDDKVLLEGKSKVTTAIDEDVAFIMTDILKTVVSRGIAGNASISGVNVGGKTGTTNDNYDIWFDGFTPKYSAALWIGTDHNETMAALSSQAALLWSNIMSQIPDITEGEYPSQPDSVTYYGGEYFTKGTESNTRRTEGAQAQNSSDLFEKDTSEIF